MCMNAQTAQTTERAGPLLHSGSPTNWPFRCLRYSFSSAFLLNAPWCSTWQKSQRILLNQRCVCPYSPTALQFHDHHLDLFGSGVQSRHLPGRGHLQETAREPSLTTPPVTVCASTRPHCHSPLLHPQHDCIVRPMPGDSSVNAIKCLMWQEAGYTAIWQQQLESGDGSNSSVLKHLLAQ